MNNCERIPPDLSVGRFNISPTTDINLIVKCVMASWDMLTDDGAVGKDLYFPPISDESSWYRAEDFGVFLMVKQNMVTFEVHTCLLPNARGKTVEIARDAIAYAWGHTEARRLITSVPAFNPLALRLAKKAGMTVFGINPNSFLKNNVLHDVTLLGISKPGESS